MIKLFFGRTECGKSYLAELLSKKQKKVIFYDYAHCFTQGEIVNDFSTMNFVYLLKKYGGSKNLNKKFSLIFRKPDLMTHEVGAEKVSYFVKMLGLSYGYRKLTGSDMLTFLVDEADKVISLKSSDLIRLTAQAGRHENIALWAISQRPMKLHPDIRDNAHEIYAFPVGKNKIYEETFGKKISTELADNKFPKYHYYYYNENGVIKKINKNGKEVRR